MESQGEFRRIKPDTYKVRIKSATHRGEDQGKNDIQVVFEVAENKNKAKGVPLMGYVSFSESSAWKLREFIDALGMKGNGTLDTDRLKGQELMAVVQDDTYQGEVRSKITKYLSAVEDEDEEDVEEEDLEDEEDEEDEEEDTDEDEDEEEDEEDDEEEEEPVAKKAPVKKGASRATNVKKSKPEPVDEEEDEEDEEDDEEEEEPESDEEEEDYSTWTLEELREEAESRGLATKGTAKTLQGRLERDDKTSAKPF